MTTRRAPTATAVRAGLLHAAVVEAQDLAGGCRSRMDPAAAAVLARIRWLAALPSRGIRLPSPPLPSIPSPDPAEMRGVGGGRRGSWEGLRRREARSGCADGRRAPTTMMRRRQRRRCQF